MLYTGVDYHRSFSYLTTMDEKGEIISQKKLLSNQQRLSKRLSIKKTFHFARLVFNSSAYCTTPPLVLKLVGRAG